MLIATGGSSCIGPLISIFADAPNYGVPISIIGADMVGSGLALTKESGKHGASEARLPALRSAVPTIEN